MAALCDMLALPSRSSRMDFRYYRQRMARRVGTAVWWTRDCRNWLSGSPVHGSSKRPGRIIRDNYRTKLLRMNIDGSFIVQQLDCNRYINHINTH